MKRFFCLAVLLSLTVSLCSCANTVSGTEGTSDAAATEEAGISTAPETEPFDLVQRRDLGGTFTVLYPVTDSCEKDFLAENVNGEVQNDAVYSRNAAVQERLGIQIAIETRQNADEVISEIRKQFSTGDSSFDMFGGHRSVLALSYQGLLQDLRRIGEIDFDAPWWDADYNDTMTINGSLYSAVGDISVASLLFVSSLTFNKRLAEESGIEFPYDKVRNRTWTYEELLATVKDYGGDTGGADLNMESDTYSIVGWSYESGYSLFYGSGFSFMSRTQEGGYKVEYSADTLNTVLEQANKLWHTPRALCYYGTGDEEHIKLYRVFAEGRALFSDICLSKIGRFYSGMTDDYGILPLPLMSKDQDRYYSYCGYTIPVTCLTRNPEDPERVGIIIEALAKSSYTMVTPKIYEIVTKSRNVRDAASPEMVEIIYRNKIYDPAHFYDLPSIGSLSRDQIKADNAGLSSKLRAAQTQAVKKWDSIQLEYDKLSAAGG